MVKGTNGICNNKVVLKVLNGFNGVILLHLNISRYVNTLILVDLHCVSSHD